MRFPVIALAAALVALILPSCREMEPVRIIFTGDDEGMIFSGG